MISKTCMIHGISGWVPKRVFVMVPSSDDRICTEMSRTAISNKSVLNKYVKMVIGSNISCSKGARERVRKLTELRMVNSAVVASRKIVVKPVERSPPRKRGERCEVTSK